MEIEFKFEVPAARLKAIERAMRTGPTTRTRLQARYFDTADGALAAHGAVLRLRKEGAHWVQTAKAVVEGQGALHRLEHNVTLDAAEDGARAVPDVRRHAGPPVGKLLDKVLGRGTAALVETLGTDIWRLARQVQIGDTRVELALDQGLVMGGVAADGTPRSSPVCELELELVEGRVEDLVALAQRWAKRHGLWFSTLSKAERGQRLRQPEASSRAVKARPPCLDDAGRLAGPAVQRAVLAACLAQVLPNASEAAAGNQDAEVVHQLRVGIRRLRTALRELAVLSGPGGPHFDAAWAPALTKVFRVLGAQRDGALLLSAMQPRLDAAGAPAMALPQPTVKKVDIGKAVRAPDFQAALVAMIGFAAPQDTEASDGSDAADPRPLLKKRLRHLHRQVLQDGESFESLPDAARHRVRKRLKRLRYLAEFVGPLFDAKAAARYTSALVPAQDALGEFNDTVVALAAYRQIAKADPQAWFAVGWLVARQEMQARACRKALARLGKLHRFWKKGG